jgi:ribosomal protein L22
MSDDDKTPEAEAVDPASWAEMNNETADSAESTASSEPAASVEAEEKPKPARKPRAAKPKADDAAAEAAPAEEKPKPARKPRAAKPKADEAVAEAPKAEATEAAEAPKAEKAAAKPAKAEKPAPAAKPAKTEKPAAAKATPKRGASKQPEPAPRRGAKRSEQADAAQVVRAQAKYVRSSARKARLVCDNIRGKSVTDARAILAHTPRAVARDWSKLLESAVANAENNHELDGEDLVIKAVTADEGPTIKRFRPRAMGRATKIRKRTAHLTILLTPKN